LHFNPAEIYQKNRLPVQNKLETPLSKELVLEILAETRKNCGSLIKSLRKKYKPKRRANIDNSQKYKEISNKLRDGTQQILNQQLNNQLNNMGISHEHFEDYIESTMDEDLQIALNILGTPEINATPPPNLDRETISEILNFHERIYQEILSKAEQIPVKLFCWFL
jgi:hypothetical protein